RHPWCMKQLFLSHIFAPLMSFLGDTFRLQYAENKGAMLSLGASLPEEARFWVFQVGIGLLLLVALGAALMWRQLNGVAIVGVALMVGGGVSNLMDRILYDGVVVDFMNLGVGGLRTGIFNVADIAIMVGAALIALQAFSAEPEPPPSPDLTGSSPTDTA
ncbi:MAG: signal peptidase II, partial [Myxococcota bacterium]